MRSWELVSVAVFAGIPLWLALRVWRGYFLLERATVAELFQMRVGAVLVSLTTGMWLAVFTLMILEDHSEDAKLMAQNLSPSKVGLINLLLCAGAFVCSGFVPKSAKTTSLRMAMRICAGVLALIWLALLANPH